MLQRSAYTNNWQTRNRRWRNIGLLWFNGISTKLSHRLTVEGHSKRTENNFSVTIIKLYASHYQFQISGLTPGSYWREQWASWLKKHENLVWICCLFVHLKKEQYAFVYKINSMHRPMFSLILAFLPPPTEQPCCHPFLHRVFYTSNNSCIDYGILKNLNHLVTL